MHKTLLILFCLITVIFAKNSIKDENIQILAKNLEIKGDVVYATGEVVVYSPNYYITANRLIYDKVKSKLELFEEVNIVQNNEIVSYSQYIFIDVKNDINNFKPMLVLDNTNKIWFNGLITLILESSNLTLFLIVPIISSFLDVISFNVSILTIFFI